MIVSAVVNEISLGKRELSRRNIAVALCAYGDFAELVTNCQTNYNDSFRMSLAISGYGTGRRNKQFGFSLAYFLIVRVARSAAFR